MLLFLLYRYVCVLSHVQLFAIPWTVAHQPPLSMGFPRQEYWSELSFPSPEDFPNSGIKPMSLVSSTLAGRFFATSTTWEALFYRWKKPIQIVQFSASQTWACIRVTSIMGLLKHRFLGSTPKDCLLARSEVPLETSYFYHVLWRCWCW